MNDENYKIQMTTMQNCGTFTEKYSKLIAEFMGYKLNAQANGVFIDVYINGKIEFTCTKRELSVFLLFDLKLYASWDCIIPVWSKLIKVMDNDSKGDLDKIYVWAKWQHTHVVGDFAASVKNNHVSLGFITLAESIQIYNTQIKPKTHATRIQNKRS